MERSAVFNGAWWGGLGALAILLSPACRSNVVTTPPQVTAAPVVAATPVVNVAAATAPAAGSSAPGGSAANSSKDAQEPRLLQRCFPDAPTWVDAPVADLLDRAATMFDASQFTAALACAEEAARQAPRSVEAHHNRAVALIRLERLDEARDALALALALDPEDPQTLEAAADFNINQLPPSADRSAIGLEYARRGSRRAGRRDPERAVRLALLEGEALIDLGRAQDALRRIDSALAVSPRLTAAFYERGVALFELCRFNEARRMFEKVLAQAPDHSHALYHLGLIDERLGDETGSERHLAAAGQRDPKTFPAPPRVSATDFAEQLQKILAALPADVKADLEGITVEAAEIPRLEDLTAETPPLSPTILGLFRGLPLGFKAETPRPTKAARAGKGRRSASVAAPVETPAADGASGTACASPDRAIVLYRRNLLRTVRDEKELAAAIQRTLMHEVGHLRGEDDGSLRDRGLE